MPLVVFVIAAIVFRLVTVFISVRNEGRLKAGGAAEYGARTSNALALAHIVFYLAAIAEATVRGWPAFNAVSGVGLALYLFGAGMLIAVIRTLGRFWTVKLLIASDHVLVANTLFRRVRHPNYYLNILPELTGFALALHAYATLLVGLPLYLIPLVLRIRQEEAVMRARFANY